MIHQFFLTQSESKNFSARIFVHFFLIIVIFSSNAIAQGNTKKILIDVAHGQKFWNDPNDMNGMDQNIVDRVKYMTSEISKNAKSVNASIGYLKGKIKPADLAACDMLFIHIPSSTYEAAEVSAINDYLQKGGSLFLVTDEDYWATLDQTGINNIVTPVGITFAGNNPDTLSGGYTKPSPITNKKMKITFHGGRIVKGGTPFCFTNQSETYPFGTYTQLQGGGKIVAMGDGMTSLYMTTWKEVNDYQCSEFMHEVFAWLLKEE